MGRDFAAVTALATGAIAQPAFAAPEEIQVYMDEMDQPGHFELDTHINYVPDGSLTNDYPGQQQSLHQLRVTPEFSYGITPSIEAGLYLPLATMDGRGRIDPGGVGPPQIHRTARIRAELVVERQFRDRPCRP